MFGFLVWGHHMFVSGQSIYAGMVFSFLTMVVAVPSAIKMFNWTATLYKGSISFDTPMLYAIGFMGLFLIGGLTGLVSRGYGPDGPFDGHIFCRRSLSLRDGRRTGDRISRRHSLLVAKDDRHECIRNFGVRSRRCSYLSGLT